MKKLLIIRHAKSSWANAGQDDYDRPLNDRGHRDAPMMAQRLLDKNVSINRFVSSTALRAFTTAVYFAKAYGIQENDIVCEKKLYHACPPEYYKLITQLDNAAETVAIFAHNPGITLFVNELCSVRIDDMPTCSVFALEISCENWSDFETAKKKFLFFDYPKA